jgi:hypothetical protein
LEALPGLGKKRAIRIVGKRPFHKKEELIEALDDPQVAGKILEYVDFN